MTIEKRKSTNPPCLNVGVSLTLSGSYWDRTDRIKKMGQTPHCCGKEMVAEDDHGRFQCFYCGHHVSL